MKAPIDARLADLLAADSDTGSSVDAVFRLRAPEGTVLIEPETTEYLTRQLIRRAERQVGQKAADWNVFKNLGSFAVSAPAPVIRAIAEQPEIAGAVANRQPAGPAKIEPVRRRPATLDDVARRPRPSAVDAGKRKGASKRSK